MTLRSIYWNASINIDSELTSLSGSPTSPIYCNWYWFDTVLRGGYICHLRIIKAQTFLGNHPIHFDEGAPDFVDLKHLYMYSIEKLSPLKTKAKTCDCILGGAHETWCHKWEAY